MKILIKVYAHAKLIISLNKRVKSVNLKKKKKKI